MMLRPGDFQFINNRTILHGRAGFEDHLEKELRRHLYRLWLNVPDCPGMPTCQSTLVMADMELGTRTPRNIVPHCQRELAYV